MILNYAYEFCALNWIPMREWQKNVRWENSENQSCVVTYWEIGKNFALSRWHKRSKKREKKFVGSHGSEQKKFYIEFF